MPYSSAETEQDRGDVKRSIWDNDQPDLTDEERERLDREGLSEEEYDRLERERESSGGWFGPDFSDARWGPRGERRFVDDPSDPGIPQAQHGFGSPKISKGSRKIDRRGPALWAFEGRKKYKSARKRWQLFAADASKTRRQRNDKIPGAW